MADGYRLLSAPPSQDPSRELAVDVLVGLSEHPRHLPSRLFYDAEGSRLFARICDLDEYYLTRAEHEILSGNAERIRELIGAGPCNVIDLGAGDGRKTWLLLEAFLRQGLDVRYVPIDVSESAMASLCERTRERFPGLVVEGLVSEYFTGIEWLAQQDARRNLVLFLGSNIGNFDRAHANQFLRRLWNALEPSDLALVGFDLKKDLDALLAAYNDSEGVTAAFNLNLLTRINRELGGDFDLQRFRHFSTYNVFKGAMESFLISLEPQTVKIEALQRSFEFHAWEPIHTELSFKYLNEDVTRVAGQTGFEVLERFWDSQERFCDAVYRVVKKD